MESSAWTKGFFPPPFTAKMLLTEISFIQRTENGCIFYRLGCGMPLLLEPELAKPTQVLVRPSVLIFLYLT